VSQCRVFGIVARRGLLRRLFGGRSLYWQSSGRRAPIPHSGHPFGYRPAPGSGWQHCRRALRRYGLYTIWCCV